MHLFLYGTLLRASATPMARWLAPSLGPAVRASVAGRLHAVPTREGWYPALVAGRPDERAWGMVCEASLAPGALVRLDRYEGREYRRFSTRARCEGRGVTVQLYRWRAALPDGAEPIPGGDFLEWLERTGRPAYSGVR